VWSWCSSFSQFAQPLELRAVWSPLARNQPDTQRSPSPIVSLISPSVMIWRSRRPVAHRSFRDQLAFSIGFAVARSAS
jgi:hypothetical protein